MIECGSGINAAEFGDHIDGLNDGGFVQDNVTVFRPSTMLRRWSLRTFISCLLVPLGEVQRPRVAKDASVSMR